jgi:putative DNA primase/helicase
VRQDRAELQADEIFTDDLSKPQPLAARSLRLLSAGSDLPDLSQLGASDAAAARDLAMHLSDVMCFDHRLTRWRVFDGQRWRVDDTGEALRRAQDYFEQRAMSAISERDCTKQQRDALVKVALKQLGARQLQNLLALLAVQDLIAVRGDEFDADPWALCVRNGLVDLQTGRCRAALPPDKLSLRAGTSFVAGAECPRWREFLHQIMEHDVDKVAFLQRLVGYLATGSTREQVFAAFHGATGANGKSVFARVVMHILDEYALTLPFASFVGDGPQGSSATPDLAAMPGRRLVLASEARPRAKFDDARVKTLTGQDQVSARPLYGRPFTFTPVAKLLFVFNERPAVSDTTSAFWRRCLLVPFNRQFRDDEQDPNLLEKLLLESPGILNWTIQGALEWQREGLNPPASVRSAVDEWRAESDVVAEFVTTGCESLNGHWTPAREMYAAFETWCERERMDRRDRLGRKAFTGRLRGLARSARRADGMGFMDLKPIEVTK